MESGGTAEEGKGRLSSGHRPFARLQLSIWSPDAGSSSSIHLSALCLFAAELQCPPVCLLVPRAAAFGWGWLSVRLLGAAARAHRVPTQGQRCGDYLRQH